METIVILIVILFILEGDTACYINSPYSIRAGHWWSYLPMSGYYAQYKNKKLKKGVASNK